MKALVLSDLATREAGVRLQAAIVGALEARGWEVTLADLTTIQVEPCLVCEHCSLKRPGVCAHRDDFAEVFARIPHCELLVLAGGVRFGTWTPTLKLAIDRFLPLLVGFYTRRHGELHHQQRYPEPSRLLGIGLLRDGRDDEVASVEHLVDRHGRNWACRAWATAVAPSPEAVLARLPAAIGALEIA